MATDIHFPCPGDLRRYIEAGKGTITVTSERTGARYTYRFDKGRARNGQSMDPIFVQLLTGPDNDHDYTYLCALLDPTVGQIKKGHPRHARVPVFTAASCQSRNSPPATAFAFIWAQATETHPRPKLYNRVVVQHSGVCGRCGRTLTTPESITLGLGPVCAQKEAA